ncbi:hypothetical protein [Herbiconiux sp.]|uniref:hypothetical protein n=1 Tax=Herbiconiux sp. TaxID=1871186 RepID=UPI0025C473D8|nr:hypothetical protein [Herbiconiux sp.]
MPDEIAEAFARFDAGLRPGPDDLVEAHDLRRTVLQALPADGRVLRTVDAGSYAHGTAVRRHSLVDVMVVLAGARPRGVGRAAELLRTALPAEAVPAVVATSRVVGGDSLVIERIGAPGIRLIPAFEAAPAGGGVGAGPSARASSAGPSDTLWVADAAHRWVRHRPAARAVLLDRIDDDGSVRALIRLLLAWKHRQAVPVSSYYLETLAIRQALQQRSFSLLWDVCWIWEALAADGLVPAPDPSSPSQVQAVRPAASIGRALEAQFPIERAASSARSAVNAFMDGDQARTAGFLEALFGPEFPALA